MIVLQSIYCMVCQWLIVRKPAENLCDRFILQKTYQKPAENLLETEVGQSIMDRPHSRNTFFGQTTFDSWLLEATIHIYKLS